MELKVMGILFVKTVKIMCEKREDVKILVKIDSIYV